MSASVVTLGVALVYGVAAWAFSKWAPPGLATYQRVLLIPAVVAAVASLCMDAFAASQWLQALFTEDPRARAGALESASLAVGITPIPASVSAIIALPLWRVLPRWLAISMLTPGVALLAWIGAMLARG